MKTQKEHIKYALDCEGRSRILVPVLSKSYMQLSNGCMLKCCRKAQMRSCACWVFKEYYYTLKEGPEIKPQAEMLGQNQQGTIPQRYVI